MLVLSLKSLCMCMALTLVTFNSCKGSKLLYFLVDGFRWDYFSLPDIQLTGFPRLFHEGTRAEWMVPDFPTNSIPNYKTLETGLHVENHGMTGNYMYDEEAERHFELDLESDSSYHPDWWSRTESFFTTAEKQEIRTGLFHVRACNVSVDGVLPTYCRPFTDSPTRDETAEALNTALRMMKNGEIDIAYVYHFNVDLMGHYHGPSSPQVKEAVLEVDSHINDVLNTIKNNVQHDVDVIVVSDHGMTDIDHLRILNITSVLDMANVRVITEGGSQAYIWPKEGKEEQVYNSLKNFNKHLHVYYKKDIKKRWYFTHHKLIPPIFLTVDKGWILTYPSDTYFGPSKKALVGNHGFDNAEEDMRSIFVAYGPDFKKNNIVKRINNVNVYQIICHVTGIIPNPHNGTWSDVMDMFVQNSHEEL